MSVSPHSLCSSVSQHRVVEVSLDAAAPVLETLVPGAALPLHASGMWRSQRIVMELLATCSGGAAAGALIDLMSLSSSGDVMSVVDGASGTGSGWPHSLSCV